MKQRGGYSGGDRGGYGPWWNARCTPVVRTHGETGDPVPYDDVYYRVNLPIRNWLEVMQHLFS